MAHFIYLILFSLFISVFLASISEGDAKQKLLLAAKTFAKFVGISCGIAWIFYILFS
jgi:hypothetical protein